jgi:hypothetical protein
MPHAGDQQRIFLNKRGHYLRLSFVILIYVTDSTSSAVIKGTERCFYLTAQIVIRIIKKQGVNGMQGACSMYWMEDNNVMLQKNRLLQIWVIK